MKSLLIGLCAAAVLCAGGRAAAQAPYPQYGAAFRHQGFYLNLDLGLGYLGSSASSTDEKLSGGAGSFAIAIGGAVQENLILAGQLWAYSVPDPTYTVGGQSVTASGVTLGLTGLGVDLVYYVMPTNLYFSIAPSFTWLSEEIGGVTVSTETGVGVRLAVGKEWWVSERWGVGVDGNMVLASNKEKGGGPTWGSFAIGVAFSATYN
jgi:opacity protein-like surface antigen